MPSTNRKKRSGFPETTPEIEPVQVEPVQAEPVQAEPAQGDPVPNDYSSETIVTPATCCPVIDPVTGACEAILTLRPHPTIPGRVVAYCNCKSFRRGLSVYEAPAEASLTQQEE